MDIITGIASIGAAARTLRNLHLGIGRNTLDDILASAS